MPMSERTGIDENQNSIARRPSRDEQFSRHVETGVKCARIAKFRGKLKK
jgi:hypothetical protein